MEKLSSSPLPEGFTTNSDLAFTGDHAISGNYNGFNVYDVSDPAAPVPTASVLCPGAQNDVSVYGDLMFLSVEAGSARVDCSASTPGNTAPVFRGVRIFDISDLTNPQQLGGVQTCRGSHTHTVVEDPDDPDSIYIYVSGTAGIRPSVAPPPPAMPLPGVELAGCNANSSLTDPTTANFRIDVIKVPLADPAAAAVVGGPRIMSTCGSSACEDQYASGALNGLNRGGVQPLVPEGLQAPGGQRVAQTSACHDITAYPAIGLAAGACQGDGLLLDISDPVNPVRIDNVTDPNFAYWHSATFNNDGTKVVFTDEWGGGSGARCRPTDPDNWGANAIFDIVQTDDGPEMELASYYKLPADQTVHENCVAHNGSLIPVPGRDIMVQAWYQGGTSVFDFTDSANPVEIGFFDRGPVSTNNDSTGNPQITLAGFWSTYWRNGSMFGNEINRGFDTFGLTASDHLNDVEIAAALQVQFDQLNVQAQPEVVWPATFTTVRAWQSAAQRQGELDEREARNLTRFVDRAEAFSNGPQRRAAAGQLRAATRQLGDSGVEQGLEGALTELSDTLP